MRSLDAAFKSLIPDTSAIQQIIADANVAKRMVADTQAVQALIADAQRVQQQISRFASQIVSPEVSQLTAELARHKEFVQNIADSVTFKLPDFRHWAESLTRCLPENLRDMRDLGDIWKIALDEGIPFSWIPRPEIVTALTDAGSEQDRLEILSQRQSDVLEDCHKALAPLQSERATQCRAAVDALRIGSYGPAQSHASNIVDSIVLDLGGNDPRKSAVDLANKDINDFSFRVAAEMLTLRPVARAFVPWWPDSGDPPPRHFSRHATAHAVGQSGVFDPGYALIAVMLATSLVVQFDQHLT